MAKSGKYELKLKDKIGVRLQPQSNEFEIEVYRGVINLLDELRLIQNKISKGE